MQKIVVTCHRDGLWKKRYRPRRVGKESKELYALLLENSAVLLLETTDLVHIDRVELTLGLLFVSGKLLVVLGFQADSSIVTNADNKDTTPRGTALVVLLVRECDVDFRDIVGRVRGRVGVGKHGVGVLVDNKDALSSVVSSLDGEAAVVGEPSVVVVVVRGQRLVIVKTLELIASCTAEQEKDGDEDQAKEDHTQDDEEQVDHVVRAVFSVGGRVGSPSKEVVKRRHFDDYCFYEFVTFCCNCFQVRDNQLDSCIPR